MCVIAADVDDITVILDARDERAEPSLHRQPSAADVISDVIAAHGTVSTQLDADDTLAGSEPGGVAEPADRNRAAIELLLWKLAELERRITLGYVS